MTKPEYHQDTFAYSSDITINYEVCGHGPQPMLLLHGYGVSLETWRDIAPLLSEDFTLYLLDLKGFGLSSKPADGAYTIQNQADIVAAFINAQDLSNVILGGNSYGGGVALVTYFLLQQQAEKIQSLLLIDTAAYPKKFPFFISFMRTPLLNRLILNLIPAYYRTRFTLRWIFYDESLVTDERIRKYASVFNLPGTFDSYIAIAKQIVPVNHNSIIEKICKINVPVLIIWGEFDPVIPLTHAHRLHKDIPNSKLEIIPECGHLPHEEKPQQTADVIRQYFA